MGLIRRPCQGDNLVDGKVVERPEYQDLEEQDRQGVKEGEGAVQFVSGKAQAAAEERVAAQRKQEAMALEWGA